MKHTVKNKIVYDTNGLEDFVTLQCPELQTAIRPEYVAKFKNYSTITEVLNKAYYVLQENPLASVEDLCRIIDKYQIELLWGRDDNGRFVGEYIAKASERELLLKEISSYNNVVVIVDDDDDNTYKYLKSVEKNIQVLTAESAQGLEFDYVVLAKNFTENSKSYDVLSEIYTSSQRSRKATIILPTTATEAKASFISKFDVRAANSIAFDDSTITEFKQWRLKLLQKVESLKSQAAEGEKGMVEDTSDSANPAPQSSSEDPASPFTMDSDVVDDEIGNDAELPSSEPSTPSVIIPATPTVLAEVTPGTSRVKPATVRGGITYKTD